MNRAFSALQAVSATDEWITARQVLVAIYIATEPTENCTVKRIASAMGVNKPSITRAFDKMENARLMERKRDTVDRRVVFAVPTAKGRKLVQQLIALG